MFRENTTFEKSDSPTAFSLARMRPIRDRGPPPRFLGVHWVSVAGGSRSSTMTGSSREILWCKAKCVLRRFHYRVMRQDLVK